MRGVTNPGLMELLRRIYLDRYLADLESGREPKKCIIFCRGMNVMAEIFVRLKEMTNYKYTDCMDSPFVMNHSSLLSPSTKVISERSSEISLYLSSNKMLLGIDLDRIDIIIFIRPYDQPSALVQGGGRGGRKMTDGKRRRVQVYQLFNSQDISSAYKSMSAFVRKICVSKECTRMLLKSYFVGTNEVDIEMNCSGGYHCCHNCDIKM